MGWLQDILGVAAPIVGGVFGGPVGSAIGGGVAGLLGGKSGSTPSGSQTVTQQQQMDPRMAAILFGNGTKKLKPGVTPTWSTGQPDEHGQTWETASNPESDYITDSGLLGRYQGMFDTPQNPGASIYGHANDNYVGKFGAYDMEQARDGANRLLAGNTAPGMQAATTQAVGVNAPAQNGMSLTGAYDRFINGDAGANPYLTKAIQGSIDQSGNQFSQMQSSATDNLKRNILPQIGSSAILAGQYGGSRQGVAEGNAIGDFAKAQQQTINQFGQNNTNAAVGAQAQSFSQGQDRSLAATQGLSAQQYGVASQDAQMAQQKALTDAQFRQQAGQSNQHAQLTTNGQNQAGTIAGMGGLTGILSGAAGQAQNQDAYQLSRASQVNGLLSPYLGLNGSSTTTQPLYQNQGGNILGGAAAGLGLYNQFKGAFGTGTNNPGAGPNGYVNWGNVPGSNPGAMGPNGFVDWGSVPNFGLAG